METKAYFKNIRSQIIDELILAETSIFVAVAWFTDQLILELLIRKAKDGVKVALLVMDDEINMRAKPLYIRINRAGGRVFLVPNYGGEMMHNKFCVIDGRTIITGSYNWTYRAARQNEENITISVDASKLADEFTKNFQILISHYYPSATFVNSTAWVQKRGVVPYADREINVLRFKIDLLELELEKLRFEEVDILKIIIQFQVAFSKELGTVVEKILRLKMKRSQLLLERNKKSNVNRSKQSAEDERLEREHAEAEREWDDYKNTVAGYKEKEIIRDITIAEQIELKARYRKACHLCHPDKVPEEMKEKANKIFIQLTEAYHRNNLEKVTRILARLERGVFAQEGIKKIDDKQVLRQRLEELRVEIKDMREHLMTIRKNEAYIIAKSISDQNKYFQQQRVILEAEHASLEQEIESLKKASN